MTRQLNPIGQALLAGLFFLVINLGSVVHAATDTTYIVTSLADSGGSCPGSNCTLRAAIQTAVAGDTITFSISGTITLASTLEINKNLTITGPGASLLNLSGNNTVQIMMIDTGATVVLSGVTITKGSAPFAGGGGIDNEGTLSLSQCIVTANVAGNYTGGGGIENNGILTIDGCVFSNNSATGIVPDGGAIDSGGDLTISNSSFSNNYAKGSAGAINKGTYGNMSISNTIFTANRGDTYGGTIFANSILTQPWTISHCTFQNNSAGSTGGAIDYFSGSALLNVTNSIFTGNTADFDGGALELEGPIMVSGSTFSGNQANYGGAISVATNELTMVNSTVYNNTATIFGGGLDIENNARVWNSTIVNNSAPANTGGGVYSNAGAHYVLFQNNIVANNTGGDCWGLFYTSSTHNLSSDATCPASAFTQKTLAQLNLVQPTGSPAYFPLRPNSVAIDAGINNPTWAPTDQRGVTRPQDGDGDGTPKWDIGSYEAIWLPYKDFIPCVRKN